MRLVYANTRNIKAIGGSGLKEKMAGAKNLAFAAQNYIEEHSAEKFSLQEMADALFVNGSYLLRTFKRYTNMTPLCYHHQVRCAKAKELLVHTDQSITEVGEAVGFVTSSHFSHIFKKVEGCTPSEYRTLHRQAPPHRPWI